MRYVCSICGYIYDEEKEGAPFASLPDTWRCPWCGAGKKLFEPERKAEAPKAPSPAPAPAEEELTELPAGVLAAICSNLARGCEKQYKDEEAALFRQIADYFTSVAPAAKTADTQRLADLLQEDLEAGYPAVSGAAQAEGDRGTQRVCVWGEKVTRILHALARQYQQEGSAFLKNTSIWVCSVCGFAYVGDRPPALCPVCKVPDWKFDRL